MRKNTTNKNLNVNRLRKDNTMQNSLHRVLNKMPQQKVQKAELTSAKPIKVNLMRIDEVEEVFKEVKNIAIVNLETAITNISGAKEELIDLISQTEEIYETRKYLENISIDIENLGIELPDNVAQMLEKMDEIVSNSDNVFSLHNQLDMIEQDLSDLYNVIN